MLIVLYTKSSKKAICGIWHLESESDTLFREVIDMIFSEKLQLLRKNKGLTQEALAERIAVSRQMPYRGPEYYQSGEYTYKCKAAGDFGWFQGYEEIYWNTEKVYECYFHGGVTR